MQIQEKFMIRWKVVKPLYDNNNVELVGKNTEFTINQVKKLTVDKSTLEMKIQ